MNTKNPRYKNNQLHCRADEAFCNDFDKFISSNGLNKSQFIRQAIQEKMGRATPPNYESLLSDNTFYNYILKESVKNRFAKKLIQNFERNLKR